MKLEDVIKYFPPPQVGKILEAHFRDDKHVGRIFLKVWIDDKNGLILPLVFASDGDVVVDFEASLN